MKEIINLVCKIYHVKKSDIISINNITNSTAVFSHSAMQELPISKSSVRFTISAVRSSAGKSFEVSLNANLKQEMADLAPGVYLVRLENDDTYIVGTKDYPAFYNSDEGLTEKSFSIKYKSAEKPYKIST